MNDKFRVDFNGKRVATDVGVGWFDDVVRNVRSGNVDLSFGHIEIAEEPMVVNWVCDGCGTENTRFKFCVECGNKAPDPPMCPVFIWTDNTNSDPENSHVAAGVVSRRLLNEDGAVFCGYFLVYPATASEE